jgi:hypothetical protein
VIVVVVIALIPLGSGFDERQTNATDNSNLAAQQAQQPLSFNN